MRIRDRIENVVYLGILLLVLIVLALAFISPGTFTDASVVYQGF